MLIRADARALPLADGCVSCVVTSPPYWGLRDYGTATWKGGDPDCAHSVGGQVQDTKAPGAITTGQRPGVDASRCRKCGACSFDQQLGLEQTPEAYVAALVSVFAEVRRVLADDGTIWLNLGDSYSGLHETGRRDSQQQRVIDGRAVTAKLSEIRQQPRATGLKPKDLCGIPWRVAFALQADGWYLRSDIIWSKPNPMPESVQGSHYSRHRVTIDEYERLSGLRYVCECAGDAWAGDVPRLSQKEIPTRKAPLSAERQGEGHGSQARGTCRCARVAAPILCVTTGSPEQRKISSHTEGASGRSEAQRELSSAAGGGRRNSHSAGLDSNTRAAQAPLLLLPEAEDAPDDGSCGSVEQGRTQLAGEHRAGVSVVQLRQEGQDDPALLVGCPGCPVCINHHGYTFHLSAGRPTKAHEYLFLLSKAARYYYDAAAIAEPFMRDGIRGIFNPGGTANPKGGANGDRNDRGRGNVPLDPDGRNKRSVWTVTTQPYPDAHFATFPEALIEPCILAGCPVGGRVLDPFIGSGTTGAVAERLGRRWVGVDLTYQHLSRARTAQRGLMWS